MALLLKPQEPRIAPPRGIALWQLGFRPFYLLAAGFGALSIVFWALQFAGLLPGAYLQGPLWHAHEMVFGFALAVIVGFLFTAGRNWTGQPTPTGGKLMALAALWLAARLLVLTPFGWLAALANVAFPLAAAVALAVPFWRARNRRNYFFVGLLTLMAGAVAAIHLERLGVIELPARAGLQVALDAVLFILSVMGGRVIPMFTNNGVPGARAKRIDWVERASLVSVLALLVLDLLPALPWLSAAVALAACAVHLRRWWLWTPWTTLRTPLVWVLHLAYLWIPVHLLLRALAVPGWVLPSLAAHALTAGAIGGLIIGMMTRTSRGHTARLLRADRWDVACYAFVGLSALIRVVVPLAVPSVYVYAIACSAGLWALGFGLFFVRYLPFLVRPRLDGQPG